MVEWIWLNEKVGGRLTIPDLVFVAASLAVLAALGPVYMEMVNSSTASYGVLILAKTVVPFAVIVLFGIIFVAILTGGVPR